MTVFFTQFGYIFHQNIQKVEYKFSDKGEKFMCKKKKIKYVYVMHYIDTHWEYLSP